MATRLYPNHTASGFASNVTALGIPAPSSWSAGWNKTTGGILRHLETTRRGHSAGNALLALSGTSGHFTASARYVSPPISADVTIDGTVKGQLYGNEAAATDNLTFAVAIKVIKPDGTDRGVLLAVSASDDTSATPPELSTTQTNRKIRDSAENTSLTLSSVAATAGDRIVIETGARQASTSTSAAWTISTSSTVASGDLPEDDTTTTFANAWFEFSSNISFGPDYYGSASTPTDSGTATNTADPTAVTPPTNMLAGDLVVMIGQQRATSATLAVSAAGGQTWTSETAIGTTNQTARVFWCQFNGTWSANPSVDFSATTCNTVVMHVFRPASTSHTWSVNQALVELDIAAAATQTITGQTTTGSNPTVTLAGWFTADDNTWGNLSGTGWAVTGNAQYRNTSGSDQSCTFAHKTQVGAGATGNVSQDQLTLGNDAATTFIITFAAASANKTIAADAGSYTITGTAVGTQYGRVVAADGGTYAITGTDVTLQKGQTVAADAGSYAITGTDAALEFDRQVVADGGSYAISGTDVTLTRNLPLNADGGSYAITGTDVATLQTRQVVADAGSYTITGTDVATLLGRQIAADAGSYTITGTDVALEYASSKTIAADAGSYAITGADVALEFDRQVVVDAGSYAITGTDAGLELDRVITADAGSYAITGQDVTLVYASAKTLDADSGSYVITGTDVDLTYLPVASTDETPRGGEGWKPRRIKRETIHPRGKTLRELFEPGRAVPAPLPEIAPEIVVAPEINPAPVSRQTVAMDVAPLIEGLESLQSAIDAHAVALAIENDDAEILMVMQ